MHGFVSIGNADVIHHRLIPAGQDFRSAANASAACEPTPPMPITNMTLLKTLIMLFHQHKQAYQNVENNLTALNVHTKMRF